MIKDKRAALAFRIAATLIAAAGLLDLLGVFGGAFHPGALLYYTAQSNILVIVLLVILSARTAAGLINGAGITPSYYPRFEMICVIDILLTFCVFWVLLVPYMAGEYYLWTFSNLAVHAITPLLCLLDYMLFSESGRLKRRDIFYVAVFPICYVVYSSIIGLSGYVYSISQADGKPVRFPYFFFDFDRIGALAFAYIGGLLVFFFGIGWLFYHLDSKVRRAPATESTSSD